MADDWRAEYEARRAREEAPLRTSLVRACEALRLLGVRAVRLEYDGEDGSGEVHAASFDPVPAAGIPDGLEGLLRRAAYWLLPPGWELEAGSFGTLTLDPATRSVHREHHRRILSSEDSSDRVDW